MRRDSAIKPSFVWYYRLRAIIWLSIGAKLLFVAAIGPMIGYSFAEESFWSQLGVLFLVLLGVASCFGMHGTKGILELAWKCPACGKAFGFVGLLTPYPHRCQNCSLAIPRPVHNRSICAALHGGCAATAIPESARRWKEWAPAGPSGPKTRGRSPLPKLK